MIIKIAQNYLLEVKTNESWQSTNCAIIYSYCANTVESNIFACFLSFQILVKVIVLKTNLTVFRKLIVSDNNSS